MRAQPVEVGCESRQTHGGPRSASPPVVCAYGTGAGEGEQYAWECQAKVGLPRMTAGREPWNIWEERSDVRRCGRPVG